MDKSAKIYCVKIFKLTFRVRVRINVRFKVTCGLELGLGMDLKLLSSNSRLSLVSEGKAQLIIGQVKCAM